MTKLIPLALNAACAAALAMIATGTAAQTPHPGRTAFDQHGCRTCHAYSSRRGAPSVRDMLVTFQGDPELALKGIDQKDRHAAELKRGAISENELRAMAEWIAGSEFQAPEPDEPPRAAAPTAVAAPVAAAEIPAPPAPPVPAEAAALPPQAAAEPTPAQAPIPRRTISGNVVGLLIEAGKKSDRLIISLSGKQPDELNMESVDGKLVISLPGFERAPRVPETLAASKQSRAVGAVQTSDEAGTLVLTVTPRSGDLKYSATQSRNRLAIELTSIPSKRKPAATAVAIAPAPPVVAAVKPAITGKPQTEAAKPAAKLATKPEASTKVAAAESAKPRPDPKVKPEAKAKLEVEAPAKKEPEPQVTAKKDVETKPVLAAAPKEADDKGKREAAAAAKAEADMLASLKASAEALRADGDKEAKSARRDRSKLKAPEKFRDEACPPLASSDPIGTVDEARAKDIIDRVGCPQCHAFVQKKTGPPFKRVFEKVKGNPSCVILRLKKNKEHNDEGVTDDLKAHEFKIVADYLATRAK